MLNRKSSNYISADLQASAPQHAFNFFMGFSPVLEMGQIERWFVFK